ncbi:MAG: type IV toxin-antitoxin system AbiEi family antitoxin domain-containing protein [Longimicrobiales bacterium]
MQGTITAADAASAGIHSQQLTRLVQQGILERVTRGHYRLAERPITEHHGLLTAWRERRFTMDALDRAARICRVERVMRPYVEALVA